MAAPKCAIKPKRNKYGAIRTVTPDGITHASKKEAARWVFLRDLEAKGEIFGLVRQVRYPLLVDGTRIGTYIPDFEYIITETGKKVTEDVKGKLTALYKRSAKHLFAQYKIKVVEVFKPETPV